MKRQSKLISQHQAEEQQAEAQQTNSEAIREFSTPEELLRHDARNTVVPDSVTRRLRESLDQESAPTRSWWRKLFGR